MAHEEIRRLTDELDVQKKEQSKLGKLFLLQAHASQRYRWVLGLVFRATFHLPF